MTGWSSVALGDVADVAWGDTSTTKSAYVSVGERYPAYSASGQDGELPYFDYERAAVVVSAIGANAGHTWLARGRWSCIKNTIRFFSRDEARVDTEYLYWATKSPQAWPRRGSAQPFISQGDARGIAVRLPPIEEQRAIAATLGALDDKIESNRRVVDLALALARGHVDRVAARVDVEPYSGRVEVRMGAAFKGNQFSEPGHGRPLLRIRDLKTFTSQTWTRESRADETVIRPGDVVVGMDAEFRATLWLGAESVLNQRVCTFRGRGVVSRAFVLAALEPQLARQEQAKTGTTVIHLNKADIDAFTVPRLSSAEHKLLADLTEPLIELAVARANENQTLTATRDLLLPELLSGRLRVTDVAG